MAVLIKGICKLCNEPFEYLRDHPGKPRAYCSDQHRWKAWREVREANIAKADSRWCPHCEQSKLSEEFSGPSAPYCKPCMAAWAREKRATETPEENYHRQRKETLARYGLTPESFAAKLAAQGGRCAICRTNDPGPAGWQIDHDHTCCKRAKSSCGKCLRDILCANCNKGIGMFNEDPSLLLDAHDYVSAWKARRSPAIGPRYLSRSPR